jgi:multiple sugar transport system substrate-binding protein
VTRLLIVLASALCLVACGGGGSGGEVRFLVFGEPEEIKAYRTLISAYREREEGDVRLIEASDREDLLARLSTSFAGGTPPDVFLLNYRFYGQFAARGVLEPLEDRVDESDEFEPGDFFPQALEAFRWDGVLTCLPQNVSSLVVYYNRHLFRRFGVPEPRRGWTWTEFVIRAAQLTRDAQGRQVTAGEPEQGAITPALFGLGVEPTLIRLAPFVWSNGGELVDDDERPTRFTLQTPSALQALEEFLKLRSVYGVVPTDVDVEAEDDETRFQNGRLAMLLSSRRSTPTFRTITAFDWDVADLPRFLEPAGILHSDAYCMANASKDKDAAWRFIEFALSPEGQRIVARTGRTVPSLKAVARSEAFLDPDAKP